MDEASGFDDPTCFHPLKKVSMNFLLDSTILGLKKFLLYKDLKFLLKSAVVGLKTTQMSAVKISLKLRVLVVIGAGVFAFNLVTV